MSYLGNLFGDEWSQYSNAAGQIYYVEISTGGSQYEIPTGYEDSPQVTFSFMLPLGIHLYSICHRIAGTITMLTSTG
jgi:hypothetical protein